MNQLLSVPRHTQRMLASAIVGAVALARTVTEQGHRLFLHATVEEDDGAAVPTAPVVTVAGDAARAPAAIHRQCADGRAVVAVKIVGGTGHVVGVVSALQIGTETSQWRARGGGRIC